MPRLGNVPKSSEHPLYLYACIRQLEDMFPQETLASEDAGKLRPTWGKVDDDDQRCVTWESCAWVSEFARYCARLEPSLHWQSESKRSYWLEGVTRLYLAVGAWRDGDRSLIIPLNWFSRLVKLALPRWQGVHRSTLSALESLALRQGDLCQALLASKTMQSDAACLGLGMPMVNTWFVRGTGLQGPPVNAIGLDASRLLDVTYLKRYVVVDSDQLGPSPCQLISEREFRAELQRGNRHLRVQTGAPGVEVLLARARASHCPEHPEQCDATPIVLRRIPLLLPPQIKAMQRKISAGWTVDDISAQVNRVYICNSRLEDLSNIGVPTFVLREEQYVLQAAIDRYLALLFGLMPLEEAQARIRRSLISISLRPDSVQPFEGLEDALLYGEDEQAGTEDEEVEDVDEEDEEDEEVEEVGEDEEVGQGAIEEGSGEDEGDRSCCSGPASTGGTDDVAIVQSMHARIGVTSVAVFWFVLLARVGGWTPEDADRRRETLERSRCILLNREESSHIAACTRTGIEQLAKAMKQHRPIATGWRNAVELIRSGVGDRMLEMAEDGPLAIEFHGPAERDPSFGRVFGTMLFHGNVLL